VDYPTAREHERALHTSFGGRDLSATAGGHNGTATQPGGNRLGFKPGMVIQELGWDEDVDDDLRVQIEDAIDADMVDGEFGNVVDAVLLWWRDDDGDLTDALMDALTDLVGGGVIWLLTPKVGRRAPSTPRRSPKPPRCPVSPPRRRPG
jgi:hypothetical protein